MMKLGKEKNNNIQFLIGELRAKLIDLESTARHLIDDEIKNSLELDSSKRIAEMDVKTFERSYNSFIESVEKLKAEMSEEEPVK